MKILSLLKSRIAPLTSIIWRGEVLAFAVLAGVPIDSSLSLNTYFGGEYQQPLRDSLYNPGNSLLELPTTLGFLDVRPDLKANASDRVELVLRPRLRLTWQSEPIVSPPSALPTLLSDLYLNEAFVALKPADSLQLTVGRQSYQWGPAESLSPSNPFFPGLLIFPEPFHEVRGLWMGRANLSIGGQLSLIALGEIPPPNDQRFESPGLTADAYEQRWAGKLDYAWDNGAHYAGLVFGREQDPDRLRLLGGGYLSLTLSSAVQIYSDGRISQAYTLLQPDTAFLFIDVSGIRYTFVDGTELRVEYISNQFGADGEQLDEINSGLAAASASTFSSGGSSVDFGLPGQNYAYVALRANSTRVVWGLFRQPSFAIRALVSLGDGSFLPFFSAESGVSDLVTLHLYGGASVGPSNSELNRYESYFFGLAARVSL